VSSVRRSSESAKAVRVPYAIAIQRQDFLKIAEQARLTAHTPEAELKRGATQRHRFEAQRKWDSSSQPSWLTEEFYEADSAAT